MIYEYRCEDCSKVFDVWAKMSDPPPTECPNCHSAKVERIISATSFALKGTGWYTTDYKRTENKGASKNTKTNSGASSASTVSETAKSESPASGSTEASASSEKSNGDKN